VDKCRINRNLYGLPPECSNHDRIANPKQRTPAGRAGVGHISYKGRNNRRRALRLFSHSRIEPRFQGFFVLFGGPFWAIARTIEFFAGDEITVLPANVSIPFIASSAFGFLPLGPRPWHLSSSARCRRNLCCSFAWSFSPDRCFGHYMVVQCGFSQGLTSFGVRLKSSA